MDRNSFIENMLNCLKTHLESHPAAQTQDVVKFVFQGLLGVGHLLGSSEEVEAHIARECEGLKPDPDELLTEKVSPDWIRLNLRRSMAEGLTPRMIANLMLNSAPEHSWTRGDVEGFCRKFAQDCGVSGMEDGLACLAEEAWLPSHSEAYRAAYRPAYRLIPQILKPLLPVVCNAAKRGADTRTLVSIDGPCASGKTTVADRLAGILDAAVIHTDDFYVPHARKTMERLAVPGGNCDWERLVSEVLAPWKSRQPGTYRRYDCHADCLLPPEALPGTKVLIVEGSYSNLPAIRTLADVRAFMNTPESVRRERLERRESPASLRMFDQRWIPLENAYFEAYKLPDEGCVVIS